MTDVGRVHGSPREWLARAQGDLALAKVPLPTGGFYEDLCFHTQQAAEKALKAVYLFHGLTFRYIHDLNVLINGLLRQGVVVPGEVQDCIFLSSYAWGGRYPGLDEPITEEEHAVAIRKAEVVVTWAERELLN
ncbi:MAG: HEPN domain-containing protein [Magnetococcales bacterium]|nr:HEPN domain-containing protein [Magnetococcales bacterium]MBF0157008.1 HEPN domain-containing protein [Magnetococcales bacterium]